MEPEVDSYQEQTQHLRAVLTMVAGGALERANGGLQPDQISLSVLGPAEAEQYEGLLPETPQRDVDDPTYLILSRHGAVKNLVYALLAEYMDKTTIREAIEQFGDVDKMGNSFYTIEELETNVSRVFLWLARLTDRDTLCKFDLFQAELLIGHMVLQVVSYMLADKGLARIIPGEPGEGTKISIIPERKQEAIDLMQDLLKESQKNAGDKTKHKNRDKIYKPYEISEEIQSRFLSRFQNALERWATLIVDKDPKHKMSPDETKHIFGIEEGKEGGENIEMGSTQESLYKATLRAIAQHYIDRNILTITGTKTRQPRQHVVSPVRLPPRSYGGRRKQARAMKRLHQDPWQQQRAARRDFRKSLPPSVVEYFGGEDNIPYDRMIQAMLEGTGYADFVEEQRKSLQVEAVEDALQAELPDAEAVDPETLTPAQTIVNLIGGNGPLWILTSPAPRARETELEQRQRLADAGVAIAERHVTVHTLDAYRSAIQTGEGPPKANPALGSGLLFRAFGIHDIDLLPSSFLNLIKDVTQRANISFEETLRQSVINLMQGTSSESILGISHKEFLDAILALLGFESDFVKEHQAVLVIKISNIPELIQQSILPVQVFYITGDGEVKERKKLLYRFTINQN